MGVSQFPAVSTTLPNKTLNTQIFRSSGTWTYPTSANFDGTVEVLCVGGGGSGGNRSQRGGNGTGSSVCSTGGGGGGQVVKKTISVLNGGDQTVIVGAGGQGSTATLGGINGGFSLFGSTTIANAYPDPELRWGLLNGPAAQVFPEAISSGFTMGNNMSVQAGQTSSGSTVPSVGSWLTTISNLQGSNASAYYSDWFSVDASTSYLVGFSYARASTNTTAQTVQAVVYWYTNTGGDVGVTDNIGSAYTIPTSGTAWTVQSATITTPSTAAYGRIVWYATNALTANHCVNGLFVTKTSTGITSCVLGNTANYQWLGAPYKSPTVLIESDNVLALGGGGGWGVLNYNTSSYIPYYPLAGFNGGGHSTNGNSATSTTIINVAGCGGGAGGAALEAVKNVPNYYTTALQGITTDTGSAHASGNQIANSTSFTGPWQWAVEEPTTGGYPGAAAFGFTMTSANRLDWFNHLGANGPGKDIDGVVYGSGGIAGFGSGVTAYHPFKVSGSVIYTATQGGATTGSGTKYFDAAANTGNGGNGVGGSTFPYRGGNGGSGIVIVRWWS